MYVCIAYYENGEEIMKTNAFLTNKISIFLLSLYCTPNSSKYNIRKSKNLCIVCCILSTSILYVLREVYSTKF